MLLYHCITVEGAHVIEMKLWNVNETTLVNISHSPRRLCAMCVN